MLSTYLELSVPIHCRDNSHEQIKAMGSVKCINNNLGAMSLDGPKSYDTLREFNYNHLSFSEDVCIYQLIQYALSFCLLFM